MTVEEIEEQTHNEERELVDRPGYGQKSERDESAQRLRDATVTSEDLHRRDQTSSGSHNSSEFRPRGAAWRLRRLNPDPRGTAGTPLSPAAGSLLRRRGRTRPLSRTDHVREVRLKAEDEAPAPRWIVTVLRSRVAR
jgi:hypothetical protein